MKNDDLARRAYELDLSRKVAQYRRDAAYVARLAAEVATASERDVRGVGARTRTLATEALGLAQRAAEVDAPD